MKIFTVCIVFLTSLVLNLSAEALSLTNTCGLNFGAMAIQLTSGSLTIAPDGSNTANNLYPVSRSGGSARYAASFTATGTSNQTFSVILPADDVVTLTGPGGATMSVSGFSSSCVNNSGQCGGDGHCVFTVGATLNVNSGQAAGQYTGTFSVTIQSNE